MLESKRYRQSPHRPPGPVKGRGALRACLFVRARDVRRHGEPFDEARRRAVSGKASAPRAAQDAREARADGARTPRADCHRRPGLPVSGRRGRCRLVLAGARRRDRCRLRHPEGSLRRGRDLQPRPRFARDDLHAPRGVRLEHRPVRCAVLRHLARARRSASIRSSACSSKWRGKPSRTRARRPTRLHGTRTGVFVGISSGDYGQLQLQRCDPGIARSVFRQRGAPAASAAGRLSYMLGLHGPSVAVDTACSSSLVAIHLACQSLRTDECRMALAGGVNLILLPEIFINVCLARMVAPDGRCKTFDAAADGYVRGEGGGVVVLKRLSDAVADGDRILAVIRATAVNQDGRSSGLTVPNGAAQEPLLRDALGRPASRRATSPTSRRTAPARRSAIRSRCRRLRRCCARDGRPIGRCGRLRQDQHRSPRSGRRHRRAHQGRARAAARRDPAAPPPRRR